ncbi:MAG: carbohydrate kinase family protein, partial [Parasporobacterium sp.]|nr:carbohydrate kinase family protein [Parasporobacterium sp.]
HNPGANNTFCGGDIPDAVLSDAVFFHFGYPTLMKKMYENEGAELEAMFKRVSSMGIATGLDLTAVDPGTPAGKADWKKILARVLPYVDFFVPSFEELCFMLDRERYGRLASAGRDMTENLDIRAEVVPLADQLFAMGCKIVLIKCGTSGLYYRTADLSTVGKVGSRLGLDTDVWAGREGIQPCFRADIVRSGAGAGDTCIAAYLTAVLSGKGPEACAALAAAEGACCVTTYDALSGLKPLEELEKRIRAGWEVLNQHKFNPDRP